MANKITLSVGPSNSGKSTWAKEYCKYDPNTKELNRDDTRIYLFCGGSVQEYNNYKFSKSKEDLVTKVIDTQAEFNAKLGHDLIVSDLNLNPAYRNKWKQWAEEHGYEYEEVLFDVPLETCLERNSKRTYSLPENVLTKQWHTMQDILRERNGNK